MADLEPAARTAELQAKKIQTLLEDCERLGAEKGEIVDNYHQILQQLNTDPTGAAARVNELQRWEHLGKTRLAPTIQSAEHQAEILWSYVAAMSSPGHRLVSFLGRKLGRTWIAVKARDALLWLMAFRES